MIRLCVSYIKGDIETEVQDVIDHLESVLDFLPNGEKTERVLCKLDHIKSELSKIKYEKENFVKCTCIRKGR